jgi:hypothetical protein
MLRLFISGIVFSFGLTHCQVEARGGKGHMMALSQSRSHDGLRTKPYQAMKANKREKPCAKKCEKKRSCKKNGHEKPCKK